MQSILLSVIIIFCFILGFHYSDRLYEENSFSVTDLFNKSWSESFNSTSVEVATLKTLLHGVCFTISFPTEVQLSDVNFITTKRSWDMVLYFHNEGEQFWLLWYSFPIIMTSLQVNINSRFKISYHTDAYQKKMIYLLIKFVKIFSTA